MTHGEEIRVEDLLGRRVRAPDGSVAGRIEEMRAVREGDYFVVAEFRLGPRALLERMAIRHFEWAVSRRFRGYTVRWDQLDLTDLCDLRLLCEVTELEHTR